MKQLIKIILRASFKLIDDLGVQIGLSVSRLLPTRTWLRIRDGNQVIRQMDYARYPIYMVVDSWIENDVRLHSAKKEPETVEWIENWFKPDDVFYDIGANVGAYSLVAFRFLGGKIKVYAFEPGFVTFPQLCRNIQLNCAEKSIIPLQVALFDHTSMIPLHYQNIVPGGALHALGAPIDWRGKRFQPFFSLPTLSYRLDDFVQQFKLPLPNHIKLDVDGMECQVLKGSSEILNRLELRSVQVEISEKADDVNAIEQLFEKKGLVLYSCKNNNALYVRKGIYT